MEEKNAIISHAEIRLTRGMFLEVCLTLDYGGAGQCMVSPVLMVGPASSAYLKTCAGPNFTGMYIDAVLRVVGAEKWSDVPGKPVRVLATHTKVCQIGHVIKNVWFNPEEAFDALAKAEGVTYDETN